MLKSSIQLHVTLGRKVLPEAYRPLAGCTLRAGRLPQASVASVVSGGMPYTLPGVSSSALSFLS